MRDKDYFMFFYFVSVITSYFRFKDNLCGTFNPHLRISQQYEMRFDLYLMLLLQLFQINDEMSKKILIILTTLNGINLDQTTYDPIKQMIDLVLQ